MSYGAIIAGLHERFEMVPGIRATLSEEPTTVQTSPLIYSLLDNMRREYGGGNMVTVRYRILHRLCIRWSDSRGAERELADFVNAIPAAIDADPQLGGALPNGQAMIEEGEAGWVTLGGTTYRSLDFYSNVWEAGPLGMV